MPAPRRAGFTMVELLVVITIIAFLLSISFAVYSDSLENARIQATKTTIRQLDSALQERLTAFQDLSFRTQAERFVRQYNLAGNMAPNPLAMTSPPIDPRRVAELMVRMDRFRAAFPQRLDDLYGFDAQPGYALIDDDGTGTVDDVLDLGYGDDSPLGAVIRRRILNGEVDLTTHDPLTESSELLYLALTEGGVFGLPSLPLDSLNQRHLRDDDADGLMEIRDEWDQPLRFYNWTTRLIRPTGEYTGIVAPMFRATAAVLMPDVQTPTASLMVWDYSHPLNQDPADPSGILAAARDGEDFDGDDSLDGTPPPPWGEDLDNDMTLDKPRYFLNPFNLQYPSGPVIVPQLSENRYLTLNTYSVPLIVSGGPDEELGLFEPAIPGDAPLRLARPLAEDVNANGSLDPGEDLDGDGALRSADELNDNITNRQR
jgi:prepilin-type N-terminal cleavage/methylation domain-containing protein